VVFDLVLALFVIALTPMALDLAWRLAVAIGDWIGRGFTWATEETEPWRSLHPLSEVRPSDYPPAAARSRRQDAARSWSSNRQGPAQVRSSFLSGC